MTMPSTTLGRVLLVCSLLAPANAMAHAGPSGELEISAKADSDEGASADADADADAKKPKRSKKSKGDKDDKWIHRWPPQRGLFEVGLYGGIYLPGGRHELFEPRPELPAQGFVRYATLAPDIGLRLGYYPLRILGIELEGGVMPTSVASGPNATIFTARGSLVLQIPKWSIVPFVLAGPALLGVASDATAVGNDIDPALHVGGGVKFNLSRRSYLRIDIRDIISNKQGVERTFQGHNFEALLGLGLVFGRKKPEPKPGPNDADGDGILDPDDECVDTPGVPEYNGCPIPDTDGDGILDPDDECVDTPGVPEYNGCPIPDTDGDGILDPDDECVDTPGVSEYKGCPIPDTDGDGILDPDDQCVDTPENKNGFEDTDGCPDEIPEAVKKFTGVIEGIYFDTNKDTIKSKSKPKLDKAVEVLKQFPTVRLEISGHTDSRGSMDNNIDLSRRRAESVKNYLIDNGIDASRLETRGAGPNEPIEDNRTKKGRAKNRRIEFRVLQ